MAFDEVPHTGWRGAGPQLGALRTAQEVHGGAGQGRHKSNFCVFLRGQQTGCGDTVRRPVHLRDDRLESDVLFVDDGDILTAARSAAALDLGLHVVRRDYGAEVANAMSRRLVFAAHRDGGPRQFVERPMPDLPDQSMAPVLAWAQERLDSPLACPTLRRVRRSVRRRCIAASRRNWTRRR